MAFYIYEQFWNNYFERFYQNSVDIDNDFRSIILDFRENKTLFEKYADIYNCFFDKAYADESRMRKSIQQNLRNRTSYKNPSLPSRSNIILIYYVYSLYSKKNDLLSRCNRFLNYRNFSPLKCRDISDYLMQMGIAFKLDFNIIKKLKDEFTENTLTIKNCMPIKIKSYSTGRYNSDLEKTTTIALKKILDNKNMFSSENIEQVIRDILVKYKNSFANFSNTRRLTALLLIRKWMKNTAYKNQSSLNYTLLVDFNASIGKNTRIDEQHVSGESYDQLAKLLNNGKLNITRQGIVILAVSAQIYDVKEINDMMTCQESPMAQFVTIALKVLDSFFKI